VRERHPRACEGRAQVPDGAFAARRRQPVVAADYPFLDLVWTMIIFFLWISWIWIMVMLLSDVFRRHDLSGWGKAAWTLLLVILPILGGLLYLGMHGKDMSERRVQEAAASRAQFDDYVRTAAGSGGPAAEIEKAKQLLDSGAITSAEFEAIKQKALATG
jgi:Short C-terminal domain/Phospholipase_D-nuclease N-terminal